MLVAIGHGGNEDGDVEKKEKEEEKEDMLREKSNNPNLQGGEKSKQVTE